MAEFYDVLGVARDASEEEIYLAYRNQLRRQTAESDPEKLILLRRAYETLIVPSTRSDYDKANGVGAHGGGVEHNLLLLRAKERLDANDHMGVGEALRRMIDAGPPQSEAGQKLAQQLQRMGKEQMELGASELAVRFLEAALHFDGASSPIRELHRRAVRMRMHELGSFKKEYPEREEVIIRLEGHVSAGNREAIAGVLGEIRSRTPGNPESDFRLAHQLQSIGEKLIDQKEYKQAADILDVAQRLDDADRQIKYLYLRAVDLAKEPEAQPPRPYVPPRRRRKASWVWFVVPALVALFLFYNQWQDRESAASPNSPISPLLPATPRKIVRYDDGTILANAFVEGKHQWAVDNGLDRDAIVLLTTTTEPRQTLLSVYIWANSTYKFAGIPDGMYSIYFTTGQDFDELSGSFTRNVRHGRFDKPVTFQAEGNQYTIYTITLHGVPGGNAPTTNVPSSLFPKID